LRKYLIAAAAAVSVISFSAVALAQGTDTATLKVKVTPTDAGTKTNPKNSTYTLDVVNGNTQRTMSDLDIFLARNVKLSLKGMPSCAPEVIFERKCPASAVLGTGEAKAKVGVNGPPANVTDLNFKVTAFKTKSQVTGKNMLGFFIDNGATLQFLTETTLTSASGKYGQKLHIDVPELAQRVGATYNGLVSLKATLKKKVGRKYLISTVGCAKGKHPYKVDLTFIPNGVTDGRVISDTATARCTK
jgi:uncharacterized OsmC-like protein